MTLLQPTDTPSRTGINNAITSEIADHASLTDPLSLHYDTGWVLVPVADPLLVAYPGRAPAVRRVGKIVQFTGSYNPAAPGTIPAGATTYAFGNLPAGFRPGNFTVVTIMGGQDTTTDSKRAWIDTGGGIRGNNRQATNYVGLSCTFMIP